MTLWESVQKNMTWRGVIIASLVAGTAFLATCLFLTSPLLDIEPQIILQYFASLALGSEVVNDTDRGILVIGVIIHYVLSFVFTITIAIVIYRWGFIVGLIGGGLLGLAIYGINFYTMTYFFEWFFAIESNVLLLSHLVFGAMAGAVYELFDHYDEPLTLEADNETA